MDFPSPAATASYFDLGTFTHSLLLEPELVAEQYAFFTGFRRQGAAYEAFKLQNPGKEIIAASMRNNGERLAKSAQSVPDAMRLLAGGQSELSIALEIDGVPVKARFDSINVDKKILVDVKTTRDLPGKQYFKQAIKDYGYDFSAGQYTAVAEAHYGCEFDFYWIVISKTDVPETRVYKAVKSLTDGRIQFAEALQKYKNCLKTGLWLDSTVQPAKVESSIEEI